LKTVPVKTKIFLQHVQTGFDKTEKKCMKELEQDVYSTVSNVTVCPPVTNEKKQPGDEDVPVD